MLNEVLLKGHEMDPWFRETFEDYKASKRMKSDRQKLPLLLSA